VTHWSKPALPIETEEAGETLYMRPDGSIISQSRRFYSEEDIGRIRAGYCCAKCGEGHDIPFPAACFGCKFPMHDLQAEYLAKWYQGTVRLGSQINVDDELEEAARVVEFERRQRDGTSPTQIWLPGGD